MAGRIRSIKPEILDDEVTANLDHLEWRLFVSTWLVADDYGNLRADPRQICGATLWAKETPETVAVALARLVELRLLTHYTVRGQSYLNITGWPKHQKVDKPGKPRMPGPHDADDEPRDDSRESREDVESEADDSNSANAHEEFAKPSREPRDESRAAREVEQLAARSKVNGIPVGPSNVREAVSNLRGSLGPDLRSPTVDQRPPTSSRAPARRREPDGFVEPNGANAFEEALRLAKARNGAGS